MGISPQYVAVSLLPTVVKVVFRLVFRVPRPATRPTPTIAAISPYSMAVAPDSFLMKRRTRVFTLAPKIA